MHLALSLAKTAASIDEVPVGAVLVKNNTVVATGYNRREIDQAACAHAELLAIQKACRNLNQWRLLGCTLYVTLEPCIMCTGAIIQARIPKVVYGASDPKGGAMGSLFNLHCDKRLNHEIAIEPGVLADESTNLLKNFFKSKRKKPKKTLG